MNTILYRITLLQPTIVTQIEGEPNSAVSYDFIPGAVLRGIIIGMYLSAYGQRDLDKIPNIEEKDRLFFSNMTRFLNAYPVINNKRSLPIPATWRTPKYGEGKAINSINIRDEAFPYTNDGSKYDPVKGFTTSNGASIYKPKRVLNIHIHRTRKTDDEPQVYRYDALAPQQTFEAMIYCADEDANPLANLLKDNPSMHIGRARSAGYGKVRIESVDIQDGYQSEFTATPSSNILTCLSDVILRDKNGHYAPTLSVLVDTLKKFGLTIQQNGNHTIQTILVGGFNRKWGLPLLQTPAIKRGSVIALSHFADPNNALSSIYQTGLGERRNEGFGQVAIGWQGYPTFTATRINSISQEVESIPQSDLDGDAGIMWHFLQARINSKGVKE